MKTSWSHIAREQADKAHKTEVDALKAKLAQYAVSVESLEKQLGIALSLGKTRIRPQPLSVSMNDKAEAVAIALASDWHVEETVEASSVNGLNEYRLRIWRQDTRRIADRRDESQRPGKHSQVLQQRNV